MESIDYDFRGGLVYQRERRKSTRKEKDGKKRERMCHPERIEGGRVLRLGKSKVVRATTLETH